MCASSVGSSALKTEEPICLFLSTQEDDIESALIRRFTMCDFSHTGFYRIADGWTYSAMADGKGIAWRPPNPKAKVLLLNAPMMQEAFKWALTQEGKAYDRANILGFVLNKDWATPNQFICDRLVFESFKQVGYSLVNLNFIPIEHLTPRDILLSPFVTERGK
jgi:hypothetical protein